MNSADSQLTPPDPYDRPIDFKGFFRPLKRRYPVLIIAAVLGATAGFLIAMSRPQLYQATSRLLIRPLVGAAITGAVQQRFLLLFDEPALVGRVLQETRLDGPPHHLSVGNLASATTARIETSGNVLFVDVRLADPEAARQVAISMAKLAVDRAREQDRNVMTASLDAIQAELDEADRLLGAARDAVLKYRQDNQAAEAARRDVEAINLERRRMQDLTAERADAEAQVQFVERELARTPPTLTLRGLETPGGERSQDEPAAAARAGTEVLNPAYTTLSTRLLTLRGLLAGNEAKLAKFRDTGQAASDRGVTIAQLTEYESRLTHLQAEVARAQRFRDQLADTSFQLRRESTLPSFALRYVDESIPAGQPIGGVTLQYAGGGMLAAVLLALAGALFYRPERA